MAQTFEWTKETWARSLSSRCWWYTPYGDGWDGCRQHGVDMSTDDSLRQIVEMEQALGAIPDWARRIVERSINFLPGCGHYRFPQAYWDAVDAIGTETPPTVVHGCFTVDRERKHQMIDYVFCLDAWRAGAAAKEAADELSALAYRKIDWQTVCHDLWEVLGDHTEMKDLLIDRLIHSQRYKIKERLWDDDQADQFGRDQYLGTIQRRGDKRNPAKMYCYLEADAPGFDEGTSPRVQQIETRLAEVCPDWPWFRYTIQYGWLCAPRTFRFLERLLWAIGKERRAVHTHDHPMDDGETVPRFLQCGDLDADSESPQWWRSFCAALDGWWQGRIEQGEVFDEVRERLRRPTPVKRWLVRLLLRKLERRDGRHISR